MATGETASDPRLALKGARVLVIEDEYYIADDLRLQLEAAGAEVIGPASTVDSAMRALGEAKFDCALVDVNLHGESAISVVELLVAMGKPFAIATGYGSSVVLDRFKAVPRIEKPFDPAALLQLVNELRRGQSDPGS